MLKLLGRLRRMITVALGLVGGVWSALILFLMAGSVALSVAMTVVPAVFAVVSGIVGSVTGVRTLAARHTDDLARLESRVATEAAGRRAAVARADNLARELTTSRAAEARLARELGDARVIYRGARTATRDAVRDTAERVSRRTLRSTTRSLASMAGEGLPVIGVAVIVASITWELKDACEMMKEMRELDAAFNPDDPISDDEVCGLIPPTRGELWQIIISSPGTAWDSARALYDDLPEVSISGSYTWTVSRIAGLWDAIFGDDPEPDPAL